MTPSDAARLSALEARERARDAVLDLAISTLPDLLSAQWPELAKEIERRRVEFFDAEVAPPSPPAAEGEAALAAYTESKAGQVGMREAEGFIAGWNARKAAAPTPGPSAKERAYDDMQPDLMRLQAIGQRLGWPAGERTLACAADALERMHAAPGPSPETIARVREKAEQIVWDYSGVAAGTLAGEILRLLDTEPRETGP